MGEMISALRRGAEPDPPLYYILQNLWVHLWGVAPVALRSLSIILFLAGLIATRAAAQAWFDRRTGIIAMLLAAVHPAHLMLGFAARWYSAMFLAVALLLWATQRLISDYSRKRLVIWSLLAATLCYINYFGPIVVAMMAIVGVLHTRKVAHWLIAGLFAVLLYIPWIGPYWQQLHDFRSGGGAAQGMASAAVRSIMALLAGNLASINSWWVWGPMSIFGAAFAALLIRRRAEVWPIAIVTLACFVAGALSGVMIEKYIMCYSGMACTLVAAILLPAVRPTQSADLKTPSRKYSLASVEAISIAGLALGWIGCGFNLVQEQHWSSLRWLDPFDRTIEDILIQSDAPPVNHWVMEHPSAWYYYGICTTRREQQRGSSPWATISRDEWSRNSENARAQSGDIRISLSRIRSRQGGEMVTIEAADLANSPGWMELMRELNATFYVHSERKYLEDPDWSLKDRLDPRYKHPQWRITVRHWRRIAGTMQ
jgi:hypothetical protein